MSLGGPKKPKESAQERALAQRGAQEWNRRVTAFLPVEDQYLRDTATGADDIAAVRGEAQSAAASGGATELRGLSTALRGAGTSMASGLGVQAIGAQSRAQAQAAGEGEAAAMPALLERQARGRLGVISTGRGLSGLASSGLQGAAQIATQRAIDHRARQQAMTQGLISGISSGAGMYVGARGLKK